MLAPFAILILASRQQPAPLADLAAKYAITIEVLKQPLDWHAAGYTVKAEPPDPKRIDIAPYLQLFEKEWSLYPPALIKRVHLHRIVFGVNLTMNGQIRAAVPAFEGDTMYYDPALGSYNAHYQRLVIHHEFFHLIDRRMGRLNRDREWSGLNPPSFHYGNGGDQMRTSGVGQLTDKIPGFLTPYATSAVEEDKAELFAHSVVDGPYVSEHAKSDPLLATKLTTLKGRLSGFEPSMGDGFWRQIAGWQLHLLNAPVDFVSRRELLATCLRTAP